MLLQRIQGVCGTLRTEDSSGRWWVLVHWMDYPRATLTLEDWQEQKKYDEEFAWSFHAWWGHSSSGFHKFEEREAREFIACHRLDFETLWWDKDDPVQVLKDAVRRGTIHAILESDPQRGGGIPRQDQNPYATVQPMMGKPRRIPSGLNTLLSDAQPFDYQSDNLSDDVTDLAARGVSEADEAECFAEYETDMELCSAGGAMYNSPAYYLTCGERVFQKYQQCRGH